MFFCKNCGGVVQKTDIFCVNCACRLDGEGMIIDKRGMSDLIAAGKEEFDADAVCTESDLSGFKVMGYLLTQKSFSFCGSDYYSAANSGNNSALIRHICFSDKTDRDVYTLLHRMDEEKAGSVFERYSELIKERALSFSEKCSAVGINALNHSAETFHSRLYGSHHVFILMTGAMPLALYAKKNPLTLRKVITIGVKISEAVIRLKSRSIEYGSFSELSVFADDNENVYLDFPFAQTRGEFLSFTALSQYEKRFFAPNGRNLEAYSLAMILYRLLSGFGNPYINSYAADITDADLNAAEKKRLEGREGIIPENSRNMFGAKLVEALNVSDRSVSIEELHSVLTSSLTYISASELDKIII